MKMYILTGGEVDEDRIKEMAKERKAIIKDLGSVRGTVIEHLLKLYYFSFANCANQWKETVWKELKEVPRQKGSNRMLDANIIFTVLWTSKEGDFDAVNRDFAIDKHGIHDEYAPIKPDPKAAIFCGNYFYWVSNELSLKGGKVDMNKAYRKLNDLIDCVRRGTLKYEYKR